MLQHESFLIAKLELLVVDSLGKRYDLVLKTPLIGLFLVYSASLAAEHVKLLSIS